ncbi:beta-N-acetylhexosaminidase, partial [Candidatus Sumerlaeota bacterium]|nr:beta-N-acetylhexosaminidase [Candidatus Sumerlaeota bacterium]
MQRAFALALSYVLAMPVVAGQLAATSASERTDGKISVIPTPMKAAMLPGIFTIRLNTVILVDKSSPDALNVGQYLADLLSGATGYKIKVSDSGKARRVKGAILLSSRDAKPELGEEGYTLVVGPESVIIRAPKPAGLFYGVQTLRQLLPPEIESRSPTSQTIAWRAPCVQIEDQPRFRWRGLLVDSARHFFPKESLKRFIELMALHKFNVLQIHFTDDQSWTLEIGALPKLTKVGAFGGPYGIGSEWLGVGKGIGSGRYYSKDDVRELVRYAAQRHITIVPEIEMPAHAASWLASYPELLCASHAKFPAPEIGKRGDATQRIIWATYRELCPSNEATYEMAGKVLAGVAELFPSGYLHIGGDEAAKLGWQNCNRCQAKMKTEGLQDVKELQSYFIKRTARIVERQGRKLVGWDEIMEGGLAPNAIVMSWRGVA